MASETLSETLRLTRLDDPTNEINEILQLGLDDDEATMVG
jgi:hypothetical protein